jgi:hypothetical protein
VKNLVIYHRADFDGKFCRAIAELYFAGEEDVFFEGWHYGDPVPEVPADIENLYMLDISVESLMDHPNLVWIDHHKSAIEKYGPREGYQIDGVAACRLAWQWFRIPYSIDEELPRILDFKGRAVDEPLVLTLAGEYDVWNLSDERAVPLQYGLTALCDDELLESEELTNLLSASPGQIEEVVHMGRAAFRWQQVFAGQVCRERSFLLDWEGQTFCVLVSTHCRNSTWWPADSIPKEATALLSLRDMGGPHHDVSLYHAPGHEAEDLSTIAVKYGGGGHRGACGFRIFRKLWEDVLNAKT